MNDLVFRLLYTDKIHFKYVLLLTVAILILLHSANIALEDLQRRELAQHLNIKTDSPYLDSPSFPVNYFWEVLKPGMTKQEVHEIVKEYERVLHCRRSSEIYYYYSENTDKALRFKIIYDEAGLFRKLMGEDDSTRFGDDECIPGLLDERLN